MGTLSSLATAGLNIALAQQAQKRQSQAINAERDRDIAAIQQRDDDARRKEEADLRRRLAQQRARLAAAGVGRGGSSQAVLRGLVEESEAGTEARQAQSALRIDDIRTTAREARRRNLLDMVGNVSRSGLTSAGRSAGRRISLLNS